MKFTCEGYRTFDIHSKNFTWKPNITNFLRVVFNMVKTFFYMLKKKLKKCDVYIVNNTWEFCKKHGKHNKS